MGKTYLNIKTKFQCKNGNAVWFSPQNGDSKVKINGLEVLTNDCKLGIVGGVRPGQCQLMIDPSTGSPFPCSSPMLSGKWNNKSQVKVSGKEILKSDCSISCPVGGNITPFKPTTISLNVDDNTHNHNVDIMINNSASRQTSNTIGDQQNNCKIGDNSDITNLDDKKTNSESEKKQISNEKEQISDYEYVLCDYQNCDRSQICEYLKASHILKETNESINASELKANMGKDAFDLYAGECSAIATSLYGSYMYSIAHHHLIPVNQCFKSFPEIVKLANYYNYNINKAENGIALPTMNVGYDKQTFDLRKEVAFNAMSKQGKQWHKGGHKYSCCISSNIDSILPKPFYNYKTAVEEKILIPYSNKLRDECKCRAANYEQQSKEFESNMDNICAKIARYLRRFEDEPQKSYPYYISKMAFYFAFNDELNIYEDELFGKDD